MLHYIHAYYVYTDQSTNACKMLSDTIAIEEWLHDDDNDQDDVLHVSIKIYNVYYICCSNILNTN